MINELANTDFCERGRHLQSLSIKNFRSFSSKQSFNLAHPDGRKGSGLSVIVGENNSGKSTILEAITHIQRYSHLRADERHKSHWSQIEVSLCYGAKAKWIFGKNKNGY